MRAFLGFRLPEESQARLMAAWENARPKPTGIRHLDEKNWHVTIAFLGEVDERALPFITERVTDWAKTIRAFELHLIRLETFPQKNPGFIAAHIERESLKPFSARIDRLRDMLSIQVPEIDRKPWLPHVSIAKVKNGVAIQPWKHPIEPIAWSPDAVELIKSVHGPNGSIYTSIQSFPWNA